jgi:hypothetical protein
MQKAYEDVAAGHAPKYVPETELEKRNEAIAERNRRDREVTQRALAMRDAGDDEGYLNALEELSGRNKKKKKKKKTSQPKTGGRRTEDTDDDEEEDGRGPTPSAAGAAAAAAGAEAEDDDLIDVARTNDAEEDAAAEEEEEAAEEVERTEGDAANAAGLKRGDDDDEIVVLLSDDGGAESGDRDGDDDGSDDDDVEVVEIETPSDVERCKELLSRRSDNKNSVSVKGVDALRRLLRCGLENYDEAAGFLSGETLTKHPDLDNVWAELHGKLPKKRGENSAYDTVSKKDCVACIAVAGAALALEYAGDKPKIPKSRLKAGARKILDLYEECLEKIKIEETAAARRKSDKAKKAATAAASAKATGKKGRPKTIGVMRTHKDQKLGYDFEARTHHEVTVSSNMYVLLLLLPLAIPANVVYRHCIFYIYFNSTSPVQHVQTVVLIRFTTPRPRR